MISDFLGIAALLFIALSITFFAYRWPAAAKVLWLAFMVRAAAALFHYYLLPLPDSAVDAKTFEKVAWELAQGGLGEIWTNFSGPDPYLISLIIGTIYSVTERSPLLAQSLSVFMGTGTVFLGWLLIRDLWNERVATKAGLALVFFPTLVLYSAITLREAYISFFFILGLLGAVRWAYSGGLRHILLATFGFIGATFFHGAMFVGLLIFGAVVLWRTGKTILLGLAQSRVQVIDIAILLLAAAPVGGFLIGAITLPYLGDFANASNPEILISKIEEYARLTGGAAYPAWIVPNSFVELLYKGPVRIVYFLFSPFPWNIGTISHLIGVFDGLLYISLTFLIWHNRKRIWVCPAKRLLLMILLGYLFVFGLAVSNFGAGIRHRAKFVFIIIALVAPLLSHLRLRNPSLISKN